VDAAYDEATSQVGSCEKDLAAYLKEVREQLGAGKEVTYCSLNKDSHLIEVGGRAVYTGGVHMLACGSSCPAVLCDVRAVISVLCCLPVGVCGQLHVAH
jgi:hypothetical protein